MAKINYWNIEQQIGSIIKTQVARATVLIEEEINWAEGDVVAIYLEEAQAPAEQQGLSAGTRLRQLITFKIWCWHFGFGKDKTLAMQARDNLVGDVQVALLGNHRLNSTVNSSWIIGCEFIAGPLPTDRGFAAGASIDLIAEAVATT